MLDKFLKSIQRMNQIQRLLFYQFLFFHLPLCQHSQIMIKVHICNKFYPKFDPTLFIFPT